MPIKVTTSQGEVFNSKTSELITYEPKTYTLEHCLDAIRKWESKWHVSFLNTEDKTQEQMLDYIRCMVVNPDDYDTLYPIQFLSIAEQKRIANYINNPMTATTIRQSNHRSREIITAEVVYYWMTELNIPFDLSYKWHFNQLMMLIQVCSIKRQPPKKMGKSEMAKSNHAINQARKKRLGTTG